MADSAGPTTQMPRLSMPTKPRNMNLECEHRWKSIVHAIGSILRNLKSDIRYADAYQWIYDLYSVGYGDLLCDSLKWAIRDFLLSEVLPKIQRESGSLLKVMSECWSMHCASSNMIHNLFLFVNKKMSIQLNGHVFSMANNLFRDEVLVNNPGIAAELSKQLLVRVRSERDGVQVNVAEIKHMCHMLQDFGASFYEQIFETPYLGATKEFYQKEAARLQNVSITEYSQTTEIHLKNEANRTSNYYSKATGVKVVDIVHEQLITEYLKNLHVAGPQSPICSALLGSDLQGKLMRFYDIDKEFNEISDFQL